MNNAIYKKHDCMPTELLTLFPSGSAVGALPNWQSPRLLFAAGTMRERWRSSALYPAFRQRAKILRGLQRTRAALKLISIKNADTSLWEIGEFVSEMLPQARTMVILKGSPGPAQKMTVQLLDRNGATTGFLKIATTAAAQNNLRNEHAVLMALPPRLGPRPLKFGSLSCGLVLLLSPVVGKPLAATLSPPSGVTHLLGRLTIGSQVSLENHPWISALQIRSDSSIASMLAPLARKQWPIAIQHGDFAPWNLLCDDTGGVTAIDWEYGTLAGFPFVDLANYHLQICGLVYRWRPLKSFERVQHLLSTTLAQFLSDREVTAIIRLAALDAYLKNQTDGHPESQTMQQWRKTIWERNT